MRRTGLPDGGVDKFQTKVSQGETGSEPVVTVVVECAVVVKFNVFVKFSVYVFDNVTCVSVLVTADVIVLVLVVFTADETMRPTEMRRAAMMMAPATYA